MKHILSFFLSVLFLLSCVSAHSGKTDGQGGHTNHSTGGYHFHHGYPAHQHPNGTCIYEFDDKTGQNSGTPGGGGSKTTQKITRVTTTTTHAVKTEKESNDFLYDIIVLFIFFGLPLVGIFWFIIMARIKERKRLILEEHRRIAEEKARYQRYCTRRDFLFEIFGEDINKIGLDAIPDDIAFTSSLLPIKGYSSDFCPYGSYTVYTTDSGKKYHHSYLCSNATNPHHLFEISSYFTPCSRCSAALNTTKPDWYQQIIDLYEQKKYTN